MQLCDKITIPFTNTSHDAHSLYILSGRKKQNKNKQTSDHFWDVYHNENRLLGNEHKNHKLC